MSWIAALLALHLAGMTFWLGGMGFLLLAIRSASVTPGRLDQMALQTRLLHPMVAMISYAMPLTLASGWVIAYLAYGRPMLWPWPLNAMQTTGLVMGGLVLLIRFGPFAMLRQAATSDDPAEMTAHAERIIRLVAISCALGCLTLIFAALLQD